ncbi:MAG: hypothetical protein IJS62_00130 [Bacteroidales bacterium]|nr:hypothetical protein [Bacteroidales bacterium]MBQ9597425.1 hypothetical protein [Bacteroidales bacterium]MCR4564982.1 hypothetical protein [Bacteroidales bacterium]
MKTITVTRTYAAPRSSVVELRQGHSFLQASVSLSDLTENKVYDEEF